MGRFRNSDDEGDRESTVDISPLIDCVFILLIFFIVTTVFVEETGVEVNRPEAASSSDLESSSILIAVTKEGNVVHAKVDIGVKGVEAMVRRQLEGNPEKPPVIIQADEMALSGIVTQVVGEAKKAGAETVSLATKRGGS